MATWRQALEVAMTDEDVARLTALSRSRTEPASRVQRAQMLLAYRENPSFFAVGQRVGVHHQTVQRCIERALAYGPLMALDDRPRPGKFLDKTLQNYLYCGLIHAALPAARIILVQRHPLDACWAIYKAHFRGKFPL